MSSPAGPQTVPVPREVDVLWPQGRAGRLPAAGAAVGALEELYAYPDGGCWVRANMVATLDGAAAGHDGRTGSVNTAVDRLVFGVLRRLAEVVVVGAGTVRAEAYGMPASTELAVVTRSGGVPAHLLEGPRRPLVLTTRAAGERVLGGLREALGADRVLVAGDEDVNITEAVDALQDRGLQRVLCEGGPSLLTDVVASGELDELCLTWSPMLTGGAAPRILAGDPVDAGFELGHLLHSAGTLLGRWVTVR